jgi:hypothetical protein
VATRELKMRWEPVVCEICQRSLLRGESPVTFYDGQAAHSVCDLCTTRAHRQGWVREGTQLAQSAPAAHAERARSLVARIRGRREALEPVRPNAAQPTEVVDDVPHHVQALPSAAEAQVTRGLGLFNLSEHSRTVSGVAHSLGAPYVYASASGPDLLVEIMVVWELCWYRFEVDLENEAVRQRGQGYEPSELASELPPANATADEQGKLALAAPGRDR